MNLHQAAAMIGATLIGKPAVFRGISTDSRSDCSNTLFVALKGQNFNGEKYCQQAIDNGAVAVISTQAQDILAPQLICADSLQALSTLAKNWCKQCKVKPIAITGSNGKTTVKNMVHSILSISHKCLATNGNFNNEIGVPLTLCQISKDDEFAIIEMGAAQIGDIKWLVSLVEPQVATITNVASAHIGRFGSIENIAIGKSEIFEPLNHDDFAILNRDDSYYDQWKSKINSKSISFGSHHEADVRVEQQKTFNLRIFKEIIENIQLPVFGVHNQINAACASAIAISFGISNSDIKKGLEQFKPEHGRMQNLGMIGGNNVIDDSYNANPQSVKAAIDLLSSQENQTTLILGDMAELGEQSIQLHTEVGAYAKLMGINQLISIGNDSKFSSSAFSKTALHFDSIQQASENIYANWSQLGTVLFKGSRSMKLEELITLIRNMEKAA
jgi:UDP-N-acetylmuramoyl-tripeptide--D-alanyl-D-alanine ligase